MTNELFFLTLVIFAMAAALTVIRKFNSSGDVSAESIAPNDLLVKLPGPALREMEAELGMLLIG